MSNKPSAFLTPLARARGLGSAHAGFHHWWLQRLTAIVLVPLATWFAYILTDLVVTAKNASDLVAWLASPFHAAALAGLLIALFWHAALGLQVVIEDYVHGHGRKLVLLLVSKFTCYGAALIGLLAIVKMHFGA